MEKNNNQKTTVDFSNLKSLNALITGSDVNKFVNELKKSKQNLDAYCKGLNEKFSKVNTAKADKPEVKQQPKVEAAVRTAENTANQRTFEKKPFNRDNNFNREGRQPYNRDNKPQFNSDGKPQFNRDGNRPQYNRDGARPPFNRDGSKPPFNRDGARPPFNRDGARPPFNRDGARPPFNRDGRPAGQDGVKQLGPKSTFVARGEVVNFVPKQNIKVNKDKAKKSFEPERKGLNIKAKIRMGVAGVVEGDEERLGRVRVKGKKQNRQNVIEKVEITNATITTDNLTVKILSEKLGKPVAELVKKFMLLGMMLNINSAIDFATAELVASEFGISLNRNVEKTAEEVLLENFSSIENKNIQKRPPIVTVMGHVDHGKTSLLDVIKKTNVITTEAGGITQHIGAYSVSVNDNKITFIDTPGHAAFTSMRARGAKLTDIAILVVAANDGIMPQTIEAINHIKEAKVPMIVAINKIDLPEANIDRIKQQLTEHDVLPEEWGGDTICVPISAKNNQNIDKLLEMIILATDVMELTADYDAPANGTVVESKVDRGRGIVATVVVNNGLLKVGDYIICGVSSGRVRAMMDYTGKSVTKAEPSMAVSIVGLNQVPEAGELVYAVEEKLAKNILAERINKIQQQKLIQSSSMSVEDFLQQSADSTLKVLKIIVKADVQGSVEAVKQTLEKLKNEEVKVQCIHSGVGSITESDVELAKASNAIIIGFNIKPEAKAKTLAERSDVKISLYKIIYEAVDEITRLITGMQAPKFEEKIIGKVEIRRVFKVSALGNIAGCYVLDGVVNRNAKVRVLRDGEVIGDTTVETLQQGKDDSKQVRTGFECGIRLKAYNDIKELDILEVYENVQIN